MCVNGVKFRENDTPVVPKEILGRVFGIKKALRELKELKSKGLNHSRVQVGRS